MPFDFHEYRETGKALYKLHQASALSQYNLKPLPWDELSPYQQHEWCILAEAFFYTILAKYNNQGYKLPHNPLWQSWHNNSNNNPSSS